MQPNFCDCGVFVLAFVEAFMRDPEAASEAIRVRPARSRRTNHAETGQYPQRSQLSWWDASLADLRETFRDRTILLSEEWKRERAAKEAMEKTAGMYNPHKSLRDLLGGGHDKKKKIDKVAVVIDPRLSKVLRPHQVEGVKVRNNIVIFCTF